MRVLERRDMNSKNEVSAPVLDCSNGSSLFAIRMGVRWIGGPTPG